jgi:hypothetical protein
MAIAQNGVIINGLVLPSTILPVLVVMLTGQQYPVPVPAYCAIVKVRQTPDFISKDRGFISDNNLSTYLN